MKKSLLCCCFVSIAGLLLGQNGSNDWYFGLLARMDFNTGFPVAGTGVLSTTEGSTSACDSTGAIMFYSDGITVYNKFGQAMPNGTGLFGGTSSTTSALAVPDPGNSSQYYLFTVDEAQGTNGFCYSKVDMTLQAGNGNVTLKNVPVKSDVTEKLTVVQKSGTSDYWVAVHEWGTDAFYVYPLTSAGFQNTPVISNTGIVHAVDPLEQNKYGQMKFNTCGTKIALAAGYLDTVEVFDFDPATGVVSNPITLPLFDHVYGVEFSEDGNMLYVTSYNTLADYGNLDQFDLTAGNQAAILASKTNIANINSASVYYYGLQIAPDFNIYVCKSWNQYLGVINSPELQGLACNYVELGFDLDPGLNGVTSGLGLPSFVQSDFHNESPCSTASALNNSEQSISFNISSSVTSDFFTISQTTGQSLNLIVTDITGKQVEQFNLSSGTSLAFGNKLVPGIYFIYSGSGAFAKAKKIIKYAR